jgi:hypothetical protein
MPERRKTSKLAKAPVAAETEEEEEEDVSKR